VHALISHALLRDHMYSIGVALGGNHSMFTRALSLLLTLSFNPLAGFPVNFQHGHGRTLNIPSVWFQYMDMGLAYRFRMMCDTSLMHVADPHSPIVVDWSGHKFTIPAKYIPSSAVVVANLPMQFFNFSGEALSDYLSCQAPLHLNAISNLCEDCPSGRFYYTMKAACACDNKFRFKVLPDGKEVCAPCVGGSFCTRTSTGLCAPGSYSLNGSSECTLCGTGRYENSSGSSECQFCGDNSQTPDRWVTFRKTMRNDAVTYVWAQGSSSQEACSCDAGFRQIVGTDDCAQCMEGLRCPGMSETFVESGYYAKGDGRCAACCLRAASRLG